MKTATLSVKCVLCTLLLFYSTLSAKEMVIGTYAYWKPMPTEAQIAKCTHLSLAFIHPQGHEGNITTGFRSKDLDSVVTMSHRHGVKVSLAFGGGGVTIDSTLMGVPEHRAKLITNLLNFIEEYNLDGFDNDWEPTFINDEALMWKTNNDLKRYYNAFTEDFRDSLDARFGVGKKIFSAAIMPLNWTSYENSPYKDDCAHFPHGFWNYLDYVILMAYDNDIGAAHSTFEFVFDEGERNTIHHWHTFGIPIEKMVLGLPIYGRAGWSGTRPGLDYNEILAEFPHIDSTVDVVTMDAGDGAHPYGFNGQATIIKKQAEAKRRGLMGVLLCFLHGDMPLDHPRSLLAVLQPEESAVIDGQHMVQGNSQLAYRVTKDQLIFSKPFDRSHNLTIYGINGQLIRHVTIQPKQKSLHFSPKDFAPGLYLLHLTGPAFSVAWKHHVH